MDEITKITETTVEAPVEQVSAEPTADEMLEERLVELMPEEERTGDMAKDALRLINQMVDERDRMVENISDDPRLAQVFADVVSGNRKPDAALVRYFGKNLLTAEEGTPEYDALLAEDEEYMNERNEMKTRREEQEQGATAFFDAFADYLDKQGLDREKYMDAVFSEVLEPALDLKVDEVLFARLVNAVDYNKDVEDAFQAGVVKGRNTNIHEMRGKIGDGMPKALSSQGAPEQPKRRVNSLIAKALNA